MGLFAESRQSELFCGAHVAQKFASLEPSLIERRDGKPAGSGETDVSEDQASVVSMQGLVGGQ